MRKLRLATVLCCLDPVETASPGISYEAMSSITNGSDNVAVGYHALFGETSGSDNSVRHEADEQCGLK